MSAPLHVQGMYLRAPLTAVLATLAASATLQHISTFNATNAGFLNILPVDDSEALVISEFTGNPFAADGISAALQLQNANLLNISLSTLSTSITWPNEVVYFPSNITAGSTPDALLVAGGFLVPPKCVGNVTVLFATTGRTAVVLSTPKGDPLFGGWFYHRPLLKDVNGDGLTDVLIPRALKPLVGTPQGELIALLQPAAADPLSSVPWQEVSIANGSFAPDVFAQLATLRGDSDPDEQLVYTSFFTGGGLAMLVCPGCGPGTPSSARNTWSNTGSLQQVLLDMTLGPSFDISVIDLNGDGKLDLLVTNHVANASLSGVYAYESPPAGTPLTHVSAWSKHTLASGFVTREPGLPGTQASPGAARAFFPCTAPGGKPSVSLAGDGDQRFYVLDPLVPSDPTDWTYNLTEVWDCKGTVGQQASTALTDVHVRYMAEHADAVAASEGQGSIAAVSARERADAAGRALSASCSVLFVPCYDSSTVQVFMFTPT